MMGRRFDLVRDSNEESSVSLLGILGQLARLLLDMDVPCILAPSCSVEKIRSVLYLL